MSKTRLSPLQRAYWMGYRRAKAQMRRELDAMAQRWDDEIVEFTDKMWAAREQTVRHIDDELDGFAPKCRVCATSTVGSELSSMRSIPSATLTRYRTSDLAEAPVMDAKARSVPWLFIRPGPVGWRIGRPSPFRSGICVSSREIASSSYGGPRGGVGEDAGVTESCQPCVVRNYVGPGGIPKFCEIGSVRSAAALKHR